MGEQVILVDEQDRELGTQEKIRAHRDASLHRAFSVFLLNSAGEMLLQRRAAGKYHSGGLWTNACCSHPRPGESTPAAAARRLREEMGIACPLEEAFAFLYRAELDGGLSEHEYDHVFLGRTDALPVPDEAEVEGWRWVDTRELVDDLRERPERYTAWFRIAIEEMLERGLLPTRD